mmetsp:Transcript_19642/g.27626  ORF Transcript_19642/g.27626 Transcript_19642/m.27626 type:complete len:88 (-) Transcript_19642:948-1211(-)
MGRRDVTGQGPSIAYREEDYGKNGIGNGLTVCSECISSIETYAISRIREYVHQFEEGGRYVGCTGGKYEERCQMHRVRGMVVDVFGM